MLDLDAIATSTEEGATSPLAIDPRPPSTLTSTIDAIITTVCAFLDILRVCLVVQEWRQSVSILGAVPQRASIFAARPTDRGFANHSHYIRKRM
jgi:hypothetical protein